MCHTLNIVVKDIFDILQCDGFEDEERSPGILSRVCTNRVILDLPIYQNGKDTSMAHHCGETTRQDRFLHGHQPGFVRERGNYHEIKPFL
jgi:hypothetical protein